MVTIDFDRPADLDYFAEKVAEKLAVLLEQPKTKHITFAEAMTELGIHNNTLTRRIADANIRTYRHGRGKAFDRNQLHKIR